MLTLGHLGVHPPGALGVAFFVHAKGECLVGQSGDGITEVLECIKAGKHPADIAMGLFRSISTRLFEMIASHDGPLAATGGVITHCRAMNRALTETLDTEVLLPPLPQHAGAYGAALMARETPADCELKEVPIKQDESGGCGCQC